MRTLGRAILFTIVAALLAVIFYMVMCTASVFSLFFMLWLLSF